MGQADGSPRGAPAEAAQALCRSTSPPASIPQAAGLGFGFTDLP